MPAASQRAEPRYSSGHPYPSNPNVDPPLTLPEIPDFEPERETVEVAAGVLRDARRRVLLARRPTGRRLAGLWEFPGGKIEPGEASADALARELAEELDIRIGPSRPLVSVRHEYPDQIVRLHLFEIHSFEGTPRGVEGQRLRWVPVDELASLEMPAADRPLIRLLELDGHFSISPSPTAFESPNAFLDAWEQCLEAGFRLIALRPRPRERVAAELVDAIDRMTRDRGARWVAAGDLAQCYGWPAHGLQLDTTELMHLDHRPWPRDRLVIASCHDLEETRIAESLEADLVTLSPVADDADRAVDAPLGWQAFERLVEYCPLPVFARGGVRPDDWARARAAGGFGVAGVRAFGWK